MIIRNMSVTARRNIAPQPEPIRIQTLGPPDLRRADSTASFPTRKTLALFFYLAVEKEQQSRELLAELFWPESPPQKSYASLRNTLRRLQIALRPVSNSETTPILLVTRTTIGLNPEVNVYLDIDDVQKAYALATRNLSGRLPNAVSEDLDALLAAANCSKGEFLAGFFLEDAPAFDDWLTIQREVWQRRLSLVLDRLSEVQFAGGDFVGAIQSSAQWIALDPLNEAAYRRKMRAHFAAGERAKAMETYEVCRACLIRDLEIEPDPDTEALADRIRTGTSKRQLRVQTLEQPSQAATSVEFLGSLFAGRDHEVQILSQSYTRAVSGQPQLVVMTGEAGIGKTRLSNRFITWARAQNAEVLHGSAFESGSKFPFQPLAEALRGKFENEESLVKWQGENWLPFLYHLLPELKSKLTHLPSRDDQTTEGENYSLQLFEALVQLTLVLSRERPLVILLDDLQWADSATLDFLHYALRQWQDASNARILLLVNMRPEGLATLQTLPGGEEGSELLQWLTRAEREIKPVRLELGPLSEDAAMEMVNAILSPPAVDFARELYAETHGHPFYMIETLKDLLERRVLRAKKQPQGGWSFAVTGPYDFGGKDVIPGTVYTVIRSRLNRLSPNAFSLLAAGAVLEQNITFEHISSVGNVQEDLALPALDELLSGRLYLEAGESESSGQYSIVNDMLRDVVYTEAGEARRRLYHHRALELLEREGESHAVLAHHALSAGLILEGFQHSVTAGQEALRLGAVNEAIFHLERASRLILEEGLPEPPSDADKHLVETRLARAYALAEKARNKTNPGG